MRVKFHTNLDKYNGYTQLWPELPAGIIPRVGERVALCEVYISHFVSKGLPTQLEVVGVEYHEEYVRVELHYSEVDVKLRDKATLFGF